MSDTERPNLATQITQITDPLLRVAKAKGDAPALLVTTLLDNVLRDAGPRQADVLRRCAIPHWVDAGVIGVLRERPDGNDRVMDKLRDYSFVRPIGPDRYAYHDQVRQALLAEWRTTNPELLRAIHLQLYNYFDTLCRDGASPRVGDNAARNDQPRAMHAMGMWDLWRREALYHLLCADSDRGLTALQDEFDTLLRGHRLAEAEALLQMTDDVPMPGRALLLVRYLTARLAQGGLRLSAASQELEALRTENGLAGELAAQVDQTLAEVYAETGEWVRATALYRRSLAYWQGHERSEPDAARQRAARASANVMLLLGEAYFGLASNTGGWYVAATPPSPVMRWLVALWEWLLRVPFVVIAWFLRSTRWQLPKPHYCAQYQNWLLIRLYRTAQEWFGAASDLFESLHDAEGALQANQHLARISLVYGYTDDALAQFTALLDSPLARDPYQRSWLERFVAEALLEKNNAAAASPLLARGLTLFRAVGDLRREAAVLALQGRAAAQLGAADDALGSYRSSLERFRTLNYAVARELILYDLRVWSRRNVDNPALRQQISQLIAAEPVKRYLARFPRALLPLLQGASLLALPLALLLLAWSAPIPAVRVLAGDQPISMGVFFDPLRALGVGVVLLPLYLASYAFLAMTVISLLPISRIDREQPDYLVTSPDGIALYNRTGALAQHMGWATIRRKVSLNRCIWTRPLPLYSRTFLEDHSGTDLRIDGITGWYVSLVADVDDHLAQAAMPLEESDLGYALLRSKSGLSCVLSALCMLIYAGAENGYPWLSSLRLLPPIIYTLFGMVTLSGVLFLVPLGYWLAYRPLKLQRTLNLSSSWPWVVIIVGAMPLLAFTLSALAQVLVSLLEVQPSNTLLSLLNNATLLPMLTYSTTVWGVYMIAAGVSALLFVGRHRLRRAVVASMVILSVASLLPFLVPLFFDQWSSVATRRAALVSDSDASMNAIHAAADAAYSASVRAYILNPDPINIINQGSAQFYAQRYDEALQLYSRAIDVASPNSPEQALAYFNRSQAQLKRDDSLNAQADLDQAKRICNQPALQHNLVCDRIRAQSESTNRVFSLPATPDPTPTPAS